MRSAKVAVLAGVLIFYACAGWAADARAGKRVRSGTGFFVSADGLLVTSAHVVAGCTGLLVFAQNDAPRAGRILAYDQRLDIALLATRGNVLQYARVGDPHEPRAGEQAFTLAYGTLVREPRKPVMTPGVFVGDGATEAGDRIILVRARLHEGNSGGPVIDPRGSLIGMVIARLTDQPDHAVVVPGAEIRVLLNGLGVASSSEPMSVKRVVRPRDLLIAISALVQCAPAVDKNRSGTPDD